MLFEYYKDSVVPKLQQAFNYANVMQIPKITKVVLNIGMGNVDKSLLTKIANDLSMIAGQMPVVTTAKRSVANFKLREGTPIGCMVTLRKNNMYYFLERFINIALPRSRDFYGFKNTSFDGQGNFSCGIKEQIVFPEVSYANVGRVYGMNIVICTTSKSDKEALELLSLMGVPFINKKV